MARLSRRLLTSAIAHVEKGERPPMTPDAATAAGMTGPSTVDGVTASNTWQDYWQAAYDRARGAAPWAGKNA